MKVTLEFKLPEEAAEYGLCKKAPQMGTLIYEFTNELRAKAKYAEKQPVSWQAVYKLWLEYLNENNIDLYSEPD